MKFGYVDPDKVEALMRAAAVAVAESCRKPDVDPSYGARRTAFLNHDIAAAVEMTRLLNAGHEAHMIATVLAQHASSLLKTLERMDKSAPVTFVMAFSKAMASTSPPAAAVPMTPGGLA